MKYALKDPIAILSKDTGLPIETVSELTFRESVCAGDLRGIKASALGDPMIDDIIKIAGRLSGQSEAVMIRLSFQDLDEIGALVFGFLHAGRKTGTTQSL